jgi:formylglycine-generating enzyme required for sulfatase activity
MKNAKLKGFFAFGFLAVLFAGCFNPVTATSPKTDDSAAEPFTIRVTISKKGEVRSVAGLDADLIKAAGPGGVRNFIQLIVTNSEGNIVAFEERRRESAGKAAAPLSIDSIVFGDTYCFLLLMGHWERNGESAGRYLYHEGRPPTLLATGLKEQKITDSGEIVITMWPIVVDTSFAAANTDVPEDSRTTGPKMLSGTPLPSELLPVEWDAVWTIKRGKAEGGLNDLIRAQKVMDPASGDLLRLKAKRTSARGDGFNVPVQINVPAETGNVITQNIGAYTSGPHLIGTSGSAYFNLEYVPFSLTGPKSAGIWNKFDDGSKFDLSAEGPVWIIRNGINDEVQDTATNFTSLGDGTANGNGAVVFTVTEARAADTLKIWNGKVLGAGNSANPILMFATAGYQGKAALYYAAVKPGKKPAYSSYIPLGSVGVGASHLKQIPIGTAGNYDVYLMLFKGGKVSEPLVINNGTPVVPSNMMFVQGGTFNMGSTGTDARADEKPVHQVTVSDFYIDRYEITQQEWEKIMGLNKNRSKWKGDNLPAAQVTWYEAVEYCNLRSAAEGLDPVYSGSGDKIVCDFSRNGYRLPTEAEWEYAAKGGAKAAAYTLYAGSNTPGDVAWYDANSGAKIHPIGQKDPNSLGLHDMSGNVREWCWDRYNASYYAKSPAKNPAGPETGGYRVSRGGGWQYGTKYIRVTDRSIDAPTTLLNYMGLRVVRSK